MMAQIEGRKKMKNDIKTFKGYKMPDMKDFDKHIIKGSLEIWLKNGNIVAYYNEKKNETYIYEGERK